MDSWMDGWLVGFGLSSSCLLADRPPLADRRPLQEGRMCWYSMSNGLRSAIFNYLAIGLGAPA